MAAKVTVEASIEVNVVAIAKVVGQPEAVGRRRGPLTWS